MALQFFPSRQREVIIIGVPNLTCSINDVAFLGFANSTGADSLQGEAESANQSTLVITSRITYSATQPYETIDSAGKITIFKVG